MRIRRFIVFGCFAAGALGQTAVTLEDCVRAGLEANPALAAAEADARSAREDAGQALASFFPSVDVSGSFKRQSLVPRLKFPEITLPVGGGIPFSIFPEGGMALGVRDASDIRLTASQPVFTGFRLLHAKKMADAAASARRSETDAKRSECVQAVEAAYGRALQARKMLDLAKSGREQVGGHLADVERFFDQGLVRQDERLKARVRRTEADLAVMQAENAIRLADAVLENAVGRPLPAGYELAPVTPDPERAPDLDASLAAAEAGRPELASARFARRAAEQGKGVASGRWFPTLAAFGTLGYGKPGINFIGKEWMDYWIVGAGLEWNLWEWGKTRSRFRQAALQALKMTETERKVREAVVLDVTRAVLRVEEAGKRLALTTEMESQAGEGFRVAENLYRQGQSTHSEFFDAQSEWTRAGTAKVQAEIDLFTAQSEWRKAVGKRDYELRMTNEKR
jgi:outer membrane protein